MEVVVSRHNDSVKYMRGAFRDRKFRAEENVFAVEGDHLCGEICGADYELRLFLHTEKAAAKYPGTVARAREKAAKSLAKSLVISEELSAYISGTKAPQGLFCAAVKRQRPIPPDARRLVVLDGVQDPKNVGAIVRIAEALCFDGVLFAGDCADIYSDKTLRASMGSALRIAFGHSGAESLRDMLPEGCTVYAAMLDDGAEKIGEVKFPEKTAVVIGSEGSGISPGIAEQCDRRVYIPIKGAESLNAAAAAAIIMWEISKQGIL